MSAPCFVYFIQAGAGGRIKVGISADVTRRISKMQSDCPHKLDVLLVVVGGDAREAEIHGVLAAHRCDGEWFEPAPEVFAYIGSLSAEAVSISKPNQPRAPRGAHEPIIAAFGGAPGMIKALADAIGTTLDREAVYKWYVNGIPWKFRPAVHRLAQERSIPLPDDFMTGAAA